MIQLRERLLTPRQTASMVDRPAGYLFRFDPANYLETIRAEVPAYDELQDAVAEAIAGIHAERVLELGVGTGQTSMRVLDLHPEAESSASRSHRRPERRTQQKQRAAVEHS
jgi:hypothetical protein